MREACHYNPISNLTSFIHQFKQTVTFIGFTLLYFKMTVMPLVSETKIVDVGKLISLGNLLVRKVSWLVLTIMSATLILSRDFGADCMTRIAYIYSRLSRTHSFHFNSQRQHALLYCNLQRQLTLFPFWLPEKTHSLSYIWLPAVNPMKCNLSALFSSLFYLYG